MNIKEAADQLAQVYDNMTVELQTVVNGKMRDCADMQGD